jgi:hypothetical protein
MKGQGLAKIVSSSHSIVDGDRDTDTGADADADDTADAGDPTWCVIRGSGLTYVM